MTSAVTSTATDTAGGSGIVDDTVASVDVGLAHRHAASATESVTAPATSTESLTDTLSSVTEPVAAPETSTDVLTDTLSSTTEPAAAPETSTDVADRHAVFDDGVGRGACTVDGCA